MPEPIDSYGLLGDTRTAALVSERGSIDWMCVPRFDGDPVFGSLVDEDRGGGWSMTPERSRVLARAYSGGAVSIETTWQGETGRLRVHEGMISDVSSALMPRAAICRVATCESGEVDVRSRFDPRLGLPGRAPQRVRGRDGATTCEWDGIAVALSNDRGLPVEPGREFAFHLRAGESASFVMSMAAREPLVFVPPSDAARLLAADDAWWRRWLQRFGANAAEGVHGGEGVHRAAVERSLLTLRLLTYAPSGAPVAAPTTSLPAAGTSTWDYRFSWPRDASIGVGAFLAFGSDEEPRAFLKWFVNASRITRPRLKVLYNLDGRPIRFEDELEDVTGYDGARPVRIGNGAAQQHQIDVYGWVIDAAWQLHCRGERLNAGQWRAIRAFADLISARWRDPDHGIWELRDEPRQYVHSKLMAWAGLDRAIRLAGTYRAGRRLERWRTERETLAATIRDQGYDGLRATYTRAFGDAGLDASMLMLGIVGFDDAARQRSTIDAIRRGLGAGGPLLYRFREPGRREGAFVPCSMWLVQALARSGRIDEAEEAFGQMCALASPLGLYAEQIDPSTRRAAGNYPQAFSHATFLQAASAINEARGTLRASPRTARERAS